jgi:hypothetical protein
MALFGPKRPAWLREKQVIIARPVFRGHLPHPARYPGRYTFWMACAVSGVSPVFLIEWSADDIDLAAETFRNWLDGGWAIITPSFFNDPGEYVFRTGAINGFIVLPDR